MKDKGTIQSFPTSDSPVNEAFEGIVELYYQTKGYITSTGKWFWKFDKNKKQRGYQDIDLLAINATNTIIVSVSSNLDDKISFKKNGEFNEEKYENLKEFFSRVADYLNATPDYAWLIQKDRKVDKIIAIVNPPSENYLDRILPKLESDGIEIMDMNRMIDEIIDYLNRNKNFKIQDQTLRLLQILNDNKIISKSH